MVSFVQQNIDYHVHCDYFFLYISSTLAILALCASYQEDPGLEGCDRLFSLLSFL